MSDTSQGPGWWQASDGKWYRPEQHPNYRPPPPPPPSPVAVPVPSLQASAVTYPGPAPYLPAQQVAVPGFGARRVVGKTRNPWGVWLLTLVTIGIYGLWWYYTVNAELRDYNEAIQVQPGVSLIALVFGGFLFYVPALVSYVRTGGRIGHAQRLAGSTYQCSGLIGFLLGIVGFGAVYYQSQLNKVWDVHGNPAPGSPVAR